MLHVIIALSLFVARDLHTIAPGPQESVGDSSRRSEIVKNLELRLSVRLVVVVVVSSSLSLVLLLDLSL